MSLNWHVDCVYRGVSGAGSAETVPQRNTSVVRYGDVTIMYRHVMW